MFLRNRFPGAFCAALLSAAAFTVTLATASAAPPTPHGAQAVDEPAYGPQLEGFSYPAPVQRFHFVSQGAQLQMAYMEVKPAQPNGRTAVLLHGKNFCGATWDSTIKVLSKAGYRVIAPDQIGFCK